MPTIEVLDARIASALNHGTPIIRSIPLASPSSFMWLTSVVSLHSSGKHTFEFDLDVKSINVLSDKAYCCGWAVEALVFMSLPKSAVLLRM